MVILEILNKFHLKSTAFFPLRCFENTKEFQRALERALKGPPAVQCEKCLQAIDSVKVRVKRGAGGDDKMQSCDPEPPPPQSY